MKSIGELELGYTDAQNYLNRQNKEMFNSVFLKNHYLDDLLMDSTYFLIGEKGTGKTAYATFLANNEYKNKRCFLKFLSATDYEKFYTLKKQKNLDLTGYAGIWKVIILLLLSKSISENDKVVSPFNKSNISKLTKIIDQYYNSAFSPEILTVLKLIEESAIIAKLISSNFELGGKIANTSEFSEAKFQTNLLFIERQFSDEIQRLKLNRDIILFIDGIDVRPDNIPYDDYINCIRGLSSACWILNTELFSNIRDSKGHFRVVLLLRPDIYASLNLQNSTNKLLDNSVFLDWRTTYKEYEKSYLYKIAVKLLSYKQSNINEDKIWEAYFPWKLNSTSVERDYDTAFMAFLRICLSRPRDILVILQYLQRKMKKDGQSSSSHFNLDCYQSDEFQNNYSEYFMSSLKDQLSFYYSAVDFEHFIKFFDYFDDCDFNYLEYKTNYDLFTEYILEYAEDIPEFVDDANKLLQLLYDCNVITAIEEAANGKRFFSFSYREKDSSNINPKVPRGNNVTYRFHYGMYKKTKFGRF